MFIRRRIEGGGPQSAARVPRLLVMLSYLLSLSLCRLAAGLQRGRSCPSACSFFRGFGNSCPVYGDASDAASVVTYSQLKTMLSSRDIQLYDVRNPDEFQAGHIPDAVNIPLDTLEGSLKLPPERFQQKFEVKAPGKDEDNLVLYCRSGNRSGKALDIARQLGFSRVRHYKGGYIEWAEREGN